MAPKAGDEIMVRDSIEAKGDEDVDMADVTTTTQDDKKHTSTGVVETSQLDDAGNGERVTRSETSEARSSTNRDGDVDASANGDDAEEEETRPAKRSRRGGRRAPDTPQRRLLELIDTVSKELCAYQEDDSEDPLAIAFQRLPHKAALPDYYAIIGDNAVAFSTVRQKVLRKTYNKFSEFVHDVARICHNAQVYNRPSAPVFDEAVRLRELFKKKLQELVDAGTIQASEAVLPDFGELPPVEDTPPPGEGIEEYERGHQPQENDEDEEDEDDEPEEEEEEEEEDSDDSRHRGRKRRRIVRKGNDDDDYGKKRGRPPKVFTPTEARIAAILKGLRKPRDSDGDLRILHFEKLPDKTHKEYYEAIPNPVALDQIKRNVKRKKYRNVDECLADLEIMFENAKHYNEDESSIYKDAVELQKEARRLVDQEKAKPDDAFRDEEGKLPLSEVEHKGETWKVGDWVHITNLNDLQKPIVAQIYRLWQDNAGKQWINACWYYRPEQTVHRVSKRFHKNEVMKTGQYRAHRVEDIVDRCFVMFHTRYHKGRPRGFPADKEVYVCEARYNDRTYVFNRIKTWNSCLPDEVREKDYQMDLFARPQRLKKESTPIAHLLANDAKESDPLPKPNWGHDNAPPIIGGVHMRPRELYISLTPPPPLSPASKSCCHIPAHLNDTNVSTSHPRTHPLSPPPSASRYQAVCPQRQAKLTSDPCARIRLRLSRPQNLPWFHHQRWRPTPFVDNLCRCLKPQPLFTPKALQRLHPRPPTRTITSSLSLHRISTDPAFSTNSKPLRQLRITLHRARTLVHNKARLTSSKPILHQVLFQPAVIITRFLIPLTSLRPSPTISAAAIPQRMMAPTQSNGGLPHANANAYIPPRHEVYTARDLDAQIPDDVRQQYQTDEHGRVLFFTAPPLVRPHPGVAESHATLGHSVAYLAGLSEHKAERQRLRKERDEKLSRERDDQAAKAKALREQKDKALGAAAGNMLGDWILGLQRENKVLAQQIAPIKAERAAWEAEKAATAANSKPAHVE